MFTSVHSPSLRIFFSRLDLLLVFFFLLLLHLNFISLDEKLAICVVVTRSCLGGGKEGGGWQGEGGWEEKRGRASGGLIYPPFFCTLL